LLGAELEERSLLDGSELVVLVFACCFSCSCSCAAISNDDQIKISPTNHLTTPHSPSPLAPRRREKGKKKKENQI
jgi:hypothetical protein